MSTNYYFKLKKEVIEKIPTILKEWGVFNETFELHIGKRSCGWKPLFQSHPGLYTSVKGLKEYYEKNKQYVDIINEYDEVFTWEGLEEELISWNYDNPDAISHIFMNENCYEAISSVMESQEFKCKLAEFNHKYPHGKPSTRAFYRGYAYTSDEDGYEFLDYDFS